MGVVDDVVPQPRPERHRARWALPVTGVAVVAALAGAIVVGLLARDSAGSEQGAGDEPATLEFVIPAGTADRIDAGESVDIMPERVEIVVGDTIRVVNHDVHPHRVGPFFLGSGQTVSHTFTLPTSIVGVCTIHASDEVVIEVTAAPG